MKRLLAIAASTAVAVGGLALTAPTASAADVVCDGDTIRGMTIEGNLVVPEGAFCSLTLSWVRGNITVGKDASLVATSTDVTEGTIKGDGFGSVTIETRGKLGLSPVPSMLVSSIELSNGGPVTLIDVQVKGNTTLSNNGKVALVGTDTVGTLNCVGNTGRVIGDSNSAGRFQGECVGLGAAPEDGSDVDIYVTEGVWEKNGRTWYTSCEPYSQTQRCTVDIWGTSVVRVSGQYVRTDGPIFNNLTYTASPRDLWVDNPLAANGEYQGIATWTSGGREWRTECDTAVTGRNGCRSYAMADVVKVNPTEVFHATGAYYYSEREWVFNNIVLFS